MNNTNLHPILLRFQVIAERSLLECAAAKDLSVWLSVTHVIMLTRFKILKFSTIYHIPYDRATDLHTHM